MRLTKNLFGKITIISIDDNFRCRCGKSCPHKGRYCQYVIDEDKDCLVIEKVLGSGDKYLRHKLCIDIFGYGEDVYEDDHYDMPNIYID
jgi:hypothetical protein